jgi:hypothetical protein
MVLRFRVLGVLIIACGLAVCYGAVTLWPPGLFEAPPASSLSVGGVLRLAGAGIAALFGAGNVVAGLAIMLFRPVRE